MTRAPPAPGGARLQDAEAAGQAPRTTTPDILHGTGVRRVRERRRLGWRRVLLSSENLLLSVLLGAMAIIPIAEIVLRSTLGFGVPGSSSIVQHLTLAVGMLGGAVAARDGRLLALAATTEWIPAGLKPASRLASGAVAATVTALLAMAAARFVLLD